jgi:hypothetical protein
MEEAWVEYGINFNRFWRKMKEKTGRERTEVYKERDEGGGSEREVSFIYCRML